MDIVVISKNVNTNITPTYVTRALKYNLFDIQHINDVKVCEISSKMEGCYDNMDSVLGIESLPETYVIQMKTDYNLNQIADQDGNVDEKCTRAFVNKITLNESFSYLACMEENIQFNYLLVELLKVISEAADAHYIFETVYNVGKAIVEHISVIYNDTFYSIMDINSGAMNYQKSRKWELFQFDSLPLYDDQKFLESFEISCKKENNSFTIEFKAKVMTLDIIVSKITGNVEPVNLSAECSSD